MTNNVHHSSFLYFVQKELKDDILRYVDPRICSNRKYPVAICNTKNAYDYYQEWGFCHGGHVKIAYPEEINTLYSPDIREALKDIRPAQFLLVYCLYNYRLMEIVTDGI